MLCTTQKEASRLQKENARYQKEMEQKDAEVVDAVKQHSEVILECNNVLKLFIMYLPFPIICM